MREVEYVIRNFDARFSRFRGKRIVLHRSREYAREIIDYFDRDYHFAGIMSRDPLEGGTFRGLRVLREEDLPLEDVDMILLTERVKYAEAVYRDVHAACEKAGILLYDMYGLDEIGTHRDLLYARSKTSAEWVEHARGFDIVAFEVMDTLFAEGLFDGDRPLQTVLMPLLADLKERGADFRFSLRKSFPEEEQIRLLQSRGLLADPERQLIRRQGEDLSFRTLREENPGKRILYIGTGLVNECILPRYYGIETAALRGHAWLAPVGDAAQARIPYDAARKERIRKEILESDLVSFDVFDTLLVRRVLFPHDVYALTERRALEKGLRTESFAERREAAETELAGGTIDAIYERLRQVFDWDEAAARQVMAIELETEKQVTGPRSEAAELADLAVRSGRRVVFTSDMYLPEARLRELLEENGIRGAEKIFVSCDEGRDKAHGLFETVRARYPEAERVLHVGDHPLADGEAAERAGIRAEVLPSPLAMAMRSGWKACAEAVSLEESTLTERCLLGQAVAAVFRDPFQDPNLKDRPRKERLQRFAEGVLPPITAGYVSWLIRELQEAKQEGDPFDGVLFLARDGYLSMRIYEKLQQRFCLPKAVYFYANRHSAFPLAADLPGTVSYVAAMGKEAGFTHEEILRKTYMLDEAQIQAPEQGETAEDYIRRHGPAIAAAAAEAKEAYRCYAKACGLKENGRYAVCDGFSIGRTQAFLERALPFRMHGFNMGRYMTPMLDEAKISFYFHGEGSVLLENYIEVESYLLSPEPSLERIGRDGEKVFQAERRSEAELAEVREVLAEAEQAALAFFETFYREGDVIPPSLPEKMFEADGYHWIRHAAYDDWAQKPIGQRPWTGAAGAKDQQEYGE